MTQPKIGDVWLRFEDHRTGYVDEFDRVHSTGPQARERRYEVTKVTPKGVWLVEVIGCFRGATKRFVRLEGQKRFAHPTRELALQSWVARKTAQVRILTQQLAYAKQALHLANFTAGNSDKPLNDKPLSLHLQLEGIAHQ